MTSSHSRGLRGCLSVMARLGQDPWEEAARWVQLPRDEIVDRLTQGIVQMPVSEQALLNARETAERLVQLLPSRAIHSETAATSASGRARLTGWTPVYVAMTLLAAAVLASQLVGRS
jgi:hypothetical protein